MKVVWRLKHNVLIENYNNHILEIDGFKIPSNAIIQNERLKIIGACKSDNSRMTNVKVSFISKGSSGESYCSLNTTPLVHFPNAFHISPGMDSVKILITNSSGNPLWIADIEFAIEYESDFDYNPNKSNQEPPVCDAVSDNKLYINMNNSDSVRVFFKKLSPDAVIPKYAHDGDVGMDMTAITVEYDIEKDMYIYHTGLAMESGYGYGAFLFPRSSNCKTDAYLTNHVGIVDSVLYRGEMQFRYKNRTPYKKSFKEWITGKVDVRRALKFAPYQPGDRVGQMVVFPYPNVESIEVNTLSDTVRGEGGFGSTGK